MVLWPMEMWKHFMAAQLNKKKLYAANHRVPFWYVSAKNLIMQKSLGEPKGLTEIT